MAEKIFFCESKSCLSHCVWQWLSVYICLEMRKEAAVILTAPQSTTQADLQIHRKDRDLCHLYICIIST